MEFSGLANLDIHWLINELDSAKDGWFQKIWKVDGGYKIRIHKEKNLDIIAIPPKAVFLTNYAYPGIEPDKLVMKIRKELEKSKLVDIYQPNFDRIIVMEFNNGKKLVFELFSKGNIILVSEDGKTMVAERYETWRDREIRPHKEYKFPKSNGLDPTKMKFDDFSEIFKENDIIRSLIKNVKLGNRYLEEACILSGENKTDKAPKNPKKLYDTIRSMLDTYHPGIQGIPVVFKLHVLKEDFKPTKTLCEAIDEVIKGTHPTTTKETTNKAKKLKIRLEEQQKALEKLKTDAVRYKQMGDLIYQNFDYLNELVKKVKAMRKEGKDWEQIKKELGIDVNKKEGKIIVDL